jgi:beta-glucanase (GH16 family)
VIDTGDGSAQGLPGWGNQERQSYSANPDSVSLDGKGNLVITVRKAGGSETCWYGPCQYTSGKVHTQGRKDVQYGRIEARIKVPAGFGVWPAFWMLGTDIATKPWPACGEIDVMEYVGRRPTEVDATLHGPGYYGSSGLTGSVQLKEPVSAAFHTFAVEWSPAGMVWTLDGVPYHHATPDDVRAGTWVFNHSFYLLLNVAVGGNLGGPVDPKLVLPARMTVAYVRVYEAVP